MALRGEMSVRVLGATETEVVGFVAEGEADPEIRVRGRFEKGSEGWRCDQHGRGLCWHAAAAHALWTTIMINRGRPE